MEKVYYSIGEMSRMFGVSLAHLRFMEKEFEQLKPKRNAKGTRFYSKEDIQTIKQILFLTKEQKLTIEGARRKLGNKKDRVAKQQEIAERLKFVKKELQGIARFLMDE